MPAGRTRKRMQGHRCLNCERSEADTGGILTDECDTKPAHSLMALPIVTVFTDDSSHDNVRDTHGDTPKHGNLAAADLVKDQKHHETGGELTDIDHPAKDFARVFLQPKSRKEDRRVVHKSVDTYPWLAVS